MDLPFLLKIINQKRYQITGVITEINSTIKHVKEADVILSIIVLRDFDALDIPQNITLVHYIDYIMLIESEVTGS